MAKVLELPLDPWIGQWSGHLYQLGRDRSALYRKLIEADADLAVLRLGADHRYVFPLRPEWAKEALLTSAANFSKRTLGYQRLSQVLGRGLVTKEGAEWEDSHALLRG